MNRVTIKDIAKHLNINPSTVSRALRNQPDISNKVKEAVIQLADQLGYKPNYAAINLRKGKSNTIGLIIPEIANYFFPNVVKAVEAIIHERGYNLLILQSNDCLDREIQNAEICASLGVEGILVSLTRESSDIEHFQILMNKGTPIVFFDKIIHDAHAYKVSIPGENAAYKAVDFILNKYKDTKNITGIFGDKRLSITQDRTRGFNRALTEHQLNPDLVQIYHAHNSNEAAEIFEKLWSKANKPDCLFLMSDEILEGVMKMVYKHQLNLPKDLKIISMSDGFLPTLYNFEFPYIKTSGFDLGKAATELLFKVIDNIPMSTKTYYIDTPLIDVQHLNQTAHASQSK